MSTDFIFSATDSSGKKSLYITDGTTAGTQELSVPGADNALNSGLDPTYFFSENGKVYFWAFDSADEIFGYGASLTRRLWVTDGTAAGTYVVTTQTTPGKELTQANTGPYVTLAPANPYASAFKTGFLFAATNVGPGNNDVVFSDGTAAGTKEVAGVTRIDSSFVSIGSKALFINYGAPWVTDGTSTGTFALPLASATAILAVGSIAVIATASQLWRSDGTIAGTQALAPAGVAASGITPTSLTALGTNKVVFAGTDSAGKHGLWVSDGTSAGTTELVVASASSFGVTPTLITSVGSFAVFSGQDSSGHIQLWTTNGTSAGTVEILPAAASGQGLQPSDLVAAGGKVYFSGLDTSGHRQLWVTDGTAAGTIEIVPAGAPAAGLNPLLITSTGAGVVFTSTSSGSTATWLSDGTVAGTTQFVLPSGVATASGFTAITPPAALDPISGTAASISTNLDAYETLAKLGQLGSITLTDPTDLLALTVTQALGDSDALAKIVGTYHIAVSDSAVAVSGGLDGLQSLAAGGSLASISLTETQLPTLLVSSAQATNDSNALALIGTTKLIVTPSSVAGSAPVKVTGSAVVSATNVFSGTTLLSTVKQTGSAVPSVYDVRSTTIPTLPTSGTKVDVSTSPDTLAVASNNGPSSVSDQNVSLTGSAATTFSRVGMSSVSQSYALDQVYLTAGQTLPTTLSQRGSGVSVNDQTATTETFSGLSLASGSLQLQFVGGLSASPAIPVISGYSSSTNLPYAAGTSTASVAITVSVALAGSSAILYTITGGVSVVATADGLAYVPDTKVSGTGLFSTVASQAGAQTLTVLLSGLPTGTPLDLERPRADRNQESACESGGR